MTLSRRFVAFVALVAFLAWTAPTQAAPINVTGDTGATNLNLTTPNITTGIDDANGNGMFVFSPTASAVDCIQTTNAATANPATVTLAANACAGSDANINLDLTAIGTGTVRINNGFTVRAPAAPGSVSTTPGTAAITVATQTGGVGGATTSVSATTVGGQGGGFLWTAGAGGAASGVSATSNTGGAAGDWTFTGALGGGATNSSTSNIGGRGSNVSFTAGNGANAGTTGGAGGNITLTAGNAGTGGTASGGFIFINAGAGSATNISQITMGLGPAPSATDNPYLGIKNSNASALGGIWGGANVVPNNVTASTTTQYGFAFRWANATISSTLTNLIGFEAFGVTNGSTGNVTAAISNAYDFRANAIPAITGAGGSVATTAGLFATSQTAGSTNNYGANIAQPALANGIGATIDSIAIKVPTATNAMADQTATTTNAMSLFLGTQTYTSATLTRTLTNAYTLNIAGQPVCSTNVTCTNAAGSLRVEGGDSIFGSAALATNATTGFVYLPTSAGTPTGVAATHTGTAAHEFDTTNGLNYTYNTAWVAPGQQMTVGDTGLLTIAQATTYYCGISGCSTTEANTYFPSAVPTIVSHMYVQLSGNVGGSAQTVVVTMMGGSTGATAESVTCTINTGASSCSDTTHQFTVAAGDLLAARVVTSATTGSFAQVSVSFAR